MNFLRKKLEKYIGINPEEKEIKETNEKLVNYNYQKENRKISKININ
jgi:hypothetical protein